LCICLGLVGLSCKKAPDVFPLLALYGQENILVKTAVRKELEESPDVHGIIWRQFRKDLPSFHESSLGYTHNPGKGNGFDVSAGGKGILFKRYLVTLKIIMTVTTNGVVKNVSEPVIYVWEIAWVLKQSDGTYGVNFTRNAA